MCGVYVCEFWSVLKGSGHLISGLRPGERVEHRMYVSTKTRKCGDKGGGPYEKGGNRKVNKKF